MKMAPKRPTPFLLFSAWYCVLVGALVVIYELVYYGLRAGWTNAAGGFLAFATGLAIFDRSRRAKRDAPADASRREIENGKP
jgi:hypothetical protein